MESGQPKRDGSTPERKRREKKLIAATILVLVIGVLALLFVVFWIPLLAGILVGILAGLLLSLLGLHRRYGAPLAAFGAIACLVVLIAGAGHDLVEINRRLHARAPAPGSQSPREWGLLDIQHWHWHVLVSDAGTLVLCAATVAIAVAGIVVGWRRRTKS